MRLLRFQHATAVYHVTTNGVADAPIYFDDADREIWVVTLGNAVSRFGLEVFSWCQMTTHFHLLLKAPQMNLDAGMKWLNGVYAQGLNRRHGRRGHLFGDRYSSWLIQDEDHLRRTARYIALNPVEAFMCSRPTEWRWSSYGATLADARPWPANAAWQLLGHFGAAAVARDTFRDFVEAGLPLARAA